VCFVGFEEVRGKGSWNAQRVRGMRKGSWNAQRFVECAKVCGMRKGLWNAQRFVECAKVCRMRKGFVECAKGSWNAQRFVEVFSRLLTRTNRLIKGKPVLRP